MREREKGLRPCRFIKRARRNREVKVVFYAAAAVADGRERERCHCFAESNFRRGGAVIFGIYVTNANGFLNDYMLSENFASNGNL